MQGKVLTEEASQPTGMPFFLIEVFLVAKNPRLDGEDVANSTVQTQEVGKLSLQAQLERVDLLFCVMKSNISALVYHRGSNIQLPSRRWGEI